MKKSLLTLILTVAFMVPVFAVEKGSMEIVPKVGYVVEPLMVFTGNSGKKVGYKQESTFSLGADFYYYVLNNLGAGVGVNYVFDSNCYFVSGWDKEDSLGATNIYVTVKPVFELQENNFIDKIYFLGQLGYGMTRYENKLPYGSKNFNENGLYWAIGAGIEKCNIIVEFMYSVDYWETKDGRTLEWTSRRLAINAGYKFNI